MLHRVAGLEINLDQVTVEAKRENETLRQEPIETFVTLRASLMYVRDIVACVGLLTRSIINLYRFAVTRGREDIYFGG